MQLTLPRFRSNARSPSTRIDRYLPDYDATVVRSAVVQADPETTYRAALDVDLLDLGPAVRALGLLRDVPRKLGNRLTGTPTEEPMRTLRFADVGDTDEWFLLEERPGEAFLVGAVGAFWRPTIEWRPVAPDAFAAFDEPGYGKLAISLAVEPVDSDRTLLTYEARTATTDERARRNFRRYWRVVGPFAGFLMSRAVDRIRADAEAIRRGDAEPAGDDQPPAPSRGVPLARVVGLTLFGLALAGAYHAALRPWHRRWGTTWKEATKRLPGDEVLEGPTSQVTHAVAVDAPAEAVWPWLVQLGQDRGGFYSYDWLESLLGADVHNLDEIVPELQELAVGDVVRLAPADHPYATAESAPEVVRLDPERALVLAPPGETPAWTWAFVLEPGVDGTARLLSRMRSLPGRSTIGPLAGHPRLQAAADYLFWEPAHFVMDRRLLLGVKARAERTPRGRVVPVE